MERALPDLIAAAGVTMQVSVISMLVGIVLALPLALGRTSSSRPTRIGSTAWVELARNTPVLLQLYFFYFGLGAFGIFLGPYFSVLAALAFNTAGYMAETLRGGFQSIPNTQMRAARSLGMTSSQAYSRIIIPQVLQVVWHPMTNQFIWVILMSSLGMLVGLRELSGETQFLQSKTFRTFEFFATTAVIYYVIAKLVLCGARLIAWRLFRSD